MDACLLSLVFAICQRHDQGWNCGLVICGVSYREIALCIEMQACQKSCLMLCNSRLQLHFHNCCEDLRFVVDIKACH